jgi:hypothetical protein
MPQPQLNSQLLLNVYLLQESSMQESSMQSSQESANMYVRMTLSCTRLGRRFNLQALCSTPQRSL